MRLTLLDVAAISGLVILTQLILTLRVRRSLLRMERRLSKVISRVGELDVHLQRLEDRMDESFIGSRRVEVGSRTSSIPRQGSAGGLP